MKCPFSILPMKNQQLVVLNRIKLQTDNNRKHKTLAENWALMKHTKISLDLIH